MNKFIFIFLFIFIFSGCSFCNAEIIKDDFIDESLNNITIEKPETNTKYNYESTKKVPIKLKISEKISTNKNEIYDAEPLVFYASKDVRYKGRTIVKKGDKFTAIVETYMERGMNGIPAIIIVDKFYKEGIDRNKIKGTYVKKGRNYSLIVYPLKWALTPIPGAGSLTNFILGGHASIKPDDDITIYYYPDWN